MNIARNICCDLSIPDATFPEEEIVAEGTSFGFQFYQIIAEAIFIEK